MILGISGASGKLGRLAVEAALEQVPAPQLVITTRTPHAICDYAARGGQVRFAGFDKPESLPEAFSGINRMFMIGHAGSRAHQLPVNADPSTCSRSGSPSRS